jgi:hypothetical protein
MSELDTVRTPFLPLIAREDFARARAIFANFDRFSTYDDWLDHQEGIQVGYLMAGVDARLVRIRMSGFLEWCEHRRILPSEPALGRFVEATVDEELRLGSRHFQLEAVAATIDADSA